MMNQDRWIDLERIQALYTIRSLCLTIRQIRPSNEIRLSRTDLFGVARVLFCLEKAQHKIELII